MSFDPMKNMKTELDAQGLGQKVTCTECCEVVFEVGANPTDAQRLAEGKRLCAHLEFSHDMVTLYARCEDPTCGRFHLSAWKRGTEPAVIHRMRSAKS